MSLTKSLLTPDGEYPSLSGFNTEPIGQWPEGNSELSFLVAWYWLIFREKQRESLKHGCEEDEELRLCQLLPQTHTMTCRGKGREVSIREKNENHCRVTLNISDYLQYIVSKS